MNVSQEIARLLLNTGVDLYIFVLWLRFVLQALGADFYNPLSQFTVQATRALVDPLDRLFQRKAPPGAINMRRYRNNRWSFGALILIVMIKLLQISLLGLLAYHQQLPAVVTGYVALLNFPAPGDVLLPVTGLLPMLVNFYFYAIVAGAILSWVAPHNPSVGAIFQVTEPILRPCRRLLPPMGGLDISPFLAIVGLQVVEILLRASAGKIAQLLGL
ncbi:MAG TPA: YggT family protein [Moraxellaceae bacterium]|nr:YggT family protein [Moraxellaceae bacterium]